MGASLRKVADDLERKGKDAPPVLSEEALEGVPKPQWMEEDPFVKYGDRLPSAKNTAIFTTGLSLLGIALMYRWNKRAGAIVDKHLRAIELAKRRGLPPPAVEEASSGEAAYFGVKALVYGTLLSTTTFVCAGSWVVHLMGVKDTREFGIKMQNILRGPRKYIEEKYPANTDRVLDSGDPDETKKEGDENSFDPLISLFGEELLEKLMKEGKEGSDTDSENKDEGSDLDQARSKR
ncbi:hypothetical protein AAMO2058_000528900 [Amorphochlora amoebiformis]|mmetsp:Transcript_18127/g.28877  ORF Transcript_18127/g.28877 Transcript_18127/m.28877 type:complete len:235 (-) Transcript_18127:82-786(-)